MDLGLKFIDSTGLRDPGEEGALVNGLLQVLPAAWWRQFTQDEISTFCVRNALYCIPTVELRGWLQRHLSGRKAIEIGSGNGVLAGAVGIPATDSRQQERPEIRMYYETLRQTPITYGANVERLSADEAVQHYKPKVVVGAWVTHRYNEQEHERGGNADGVDEDFVIERAEYVHVGHTFTHRHKPIWKREHTMLYPDWLVSRAFNEGQNYIAIWTKGAR